MDQLKRLDEHFECRGWFDADELLMALLVEDVDKLAEFRAICKKLKAKKSEALRKMNSLATHEEREAFLANLAAPDSAKEVSKEEKEAEKQAMTLKGEKNVSIG